ncbi:MAG: hypothetical protein MI923_10005 [Phycisphaerales bacterium]|nr:hypothetical protein [Phycisphaerales bacterium]
MGDINVLSVLMRWLHISGAVVAVGGSVFALIALLPAMRGLSDEIRSDLHEAIRKRFAMLFMISVTALLVSGFYNYLLNEIPQHKGDGLYHGLMGAKILLAFVVFFLGSALVGRAAAFEGIRRRRKRWMTVNILLALIIIALAALLRAMPNTT